MIFSLVKEMYTCIRDWLPKVTSMPWLDVIMMLYDHVTTLRMHDYETLESITRTSVTRMDKLHVYVAQFPNPLT